MISFLTYAIGIVVGFIVGRRWDALFGKSNPYSDGKIPKIEPIELWPPPPLSEGKQSKGGRNTEFYITRRPPPPKPLGKR